MGSHARLYHDVLNSMAWKALSHTAVHLYIELRKRMHDYNNGRVTATLRELTHDGFSSPSTVAKCLRELEAVGLLAKTRQGGIANGGKLTNWFRFTDKAVPGFVKEGIAASEATYDWRALKTKKEAEELIKAAHKAAKRPTKPNDIKVQKMKRCASEFEAGTLQGASISGAEAQTRVQKSNWRRAPSTAPTH